MKRSWMAVLGVLTFSAFAGSVRAELGEGVKVGDVRISPWGSLKLGYNSNVQYGDADKQDDFSITEELGSKFAYEVGQLNLKADLWGRAEQYADLSDENHEDFGQSLSAVFTTPGDLSLTASESFYDVTALDYGTGDIEETRNLNLKLRADQNGLTDKVDVGGGYEFNLLDYSSSRLYDWMENSVVAEGAYQVTEKSSGMVTIKGGVQSSDANESDAGFGILRVGAKTRSTAKVVGRAGLGVEAHGEYSDSVILSYELAGTWRTTEKINFFAGVDNAIEPSTQDLENYKLVNRAQVGGRWQVIDTVSGTVAGIYRNEAYDEPVTGPQGTVDKDVDTLTGLCRVAYVPPAKFLEVFGEAKIETRSSSVPNDDYDQAVIAFGVIGRY